MSASARELMAEYPRADVEAAHHFDGPRLCARLSYGDGRHALAMGPADEVAVWLKENYQAPAGEGDGSPIPGSSPAGQEAPDVH